jgi:hypothetical protein
MEPRFWLLNISGCKELGSLRETAHCTAGVGKIKEFRIYYCTKKQSTAQRMLEAYQKDRSKKKVLPLGKSGVI